jgi:hypothetical protein
VAVAAHDRHARLRQPLLGPDDVHDAGAGIAHRVAADAELRAVAREHVDLRGRDRIGERLVEAGRRDVVVHRRDREIGAAHRAPFEPETVERLGRGHLVHEVEVDEQQLRLAGRRADDVGLPHLLGQGAGHLRSSLGSSVAGQRLV